MFGLRFRLHLHRLTSRCRQPQAFRALGLSESFNGVIDSFDSELWKDSFLSQNFRTAYKEETAAVEREVSFLFS